MTSAQDFEMSVTANSPSQDSLHPQNQIPLGYVPPKFKPLAIFHLDGRLLCHA